MGVNDANVTQTATINRQEIPAKNKTPAPELATNKAVPKSGCLAIKRVGTAIRIIAIKNCFDLGLDLAWSECSSDDLCPHFSPVFLREIRR